MSHEFYTTNPLLGGATFAMIGGIIESKYGATGCWHVGALALIVIGIPSTIGGYVSTANYFAWTFGFSLHAFMSATLLGIGASQFRGGGHPILFWTLAGLAGAQALGGVIAILAQPFRKKGPEGP